MLEPDLEAAAGHRYGWSTTLVLQPETNWCGGSRYG
jgi:hypothetical protein